MNFQQIEQLWISNGGDPGWAPLMAGIAEAESGGNPTALNNNPSTGDYSVGLWQINFYDGLAASRTARYGSPQALLADPNAQAKAAIDLFGQNGAGLSNWKGDATWKAWFGAGAPQKPSAATVSGWLGGEGLQGNANTVTGAPATNQNGSGVGGCNTNPGINLGVGPLSIGHVGTGCQLKALTGGLLIGMGAGIMLVGATLIAAYGLAHTGVGRAVTQTVSRGPVRAGARAVASRSRTAATSPPAPVEPTLSEEDADYYEGQAQVVRMDTHRRSRYNAWLREGFVPTAGDA